MLTTLVNKPRTATLVPTMEQRLARTQRPISKVLLMQTLGCNGTAYLSVNGIKCILSGMQRESGSGNSFMLTLYGPDGKMYTCHTYTN